LREDGVDLGVGNAGSKESGGNGGETHLDVLVELFVWWVDGEVVGLS